MTSNQKLGIQVKDIFYTPGGPHDRAIIVEAEGLEPINKFRSRIQSLGNVLLCTGTYSALSIPYSIGTRKSESGERLMELLKRLLVEEDGQGLVEYTLMEIT